jgi:hypothetical protein
MPVPAPSSNTRLHCATSARKSVDAASSWANMRALDHTVKACSSRVAAALNTA